MLNFLGIGAQKAGTTWLYETLLRHPDIAFPGGKEIHFWNRDQHLGLGWYNGLFADNSHINGEITPAYAILPVETIREIQHLYPALRLIYIIRNPIERAWSSAKMESQRAGEKLPEVPDQWFIDQFRSSDSLSRGDYETCIRNWLSVFSPEQLLVLRHEELRDQPLSLLENVCRHLGVENIYAGCNGDDLKQPVFAGAKEPLRPSLLPELMEIYDWRISSLAAYLREDLSGWRCA
jgi:hypothetical protein